MTNAIFFQEQNIFATKTQTQVERFRVQRSGLKNIQPVRIKQFLLSDFVPLWPFFRFIRARF
jgi:hypothetical protein